MPSTKLYQAYSGRKFSMQWVHDSIYAVSQTNKIELFLKFWGFYEKNLKMTEFYLFICNTMSTLLRDISIIYKTLLLVQYLGTIMEF